MSDIVKRLRALKIMDEVGSDNPLGRDAADKIERLQKKLAVIAKHPDTPELIKQYAAGRLDAPEPPGAGGREVQ